MENSEPPPPLRVLSARGTEKGYLVTQVVLKDTVPQWTRWGWNFIATDPQDQEDLIRWYEQHWQA
jgi:hypothetical protein